jgi:oxygen-dependent protoporphyrinogen oxidase
VYNAQADQQSLLATFPQFAAMERERRSLILAARAQTSKQRQVQPAQPTRSPAFFSFDGGTQMLVDALVTQLDASLRLGARVNGVHESELRLVVTLENSPDISCDAVIVATPAQATARVLRSAAPAVAAELGQMRTSSIGSAHLAFRTGDVPRPLGGIGLVIPASERRPIDGITWTSTKWLRRAPEGVSLLRVFFGGPHTRATFDLDDSHLIDVVRSELLTMFGIANAPLFSRVFRLADGYPCYDVGHLERVGRIEANLPGRIAVAGSAYHGVGVPDCVHSGQLAADKITGFLQGLPQPTQKVGGDAV